jgi:hypothetical protein
MMNKVAFALAMVGALAFASDIALAQGRGGSSGGGGGGGSRGGAPGGGWQGGGGTGGGTGWQGGGGNRGGGGTGWQGGGSYRGGGGSGWHGRGGYRGSGWYGGGGHRGWYGGGGYYRGGGWYGGWYGPGWNWGWYGSGVGIAIGGPSYWGAWPYPYYAPYPYYYPYSTFPYPVSDPDRYVQQTPDEAPPAQSAYWYYCTEPAGYYPYIQKCSRPWMQVLPQNVPGADLGTVPSAPTAPAAQ